MFCHVVPFVVMPAPSPQVRPNERPALVPALSSIAFPGDEKPLFVWLYTAGRKICEDSRRKEHQQTDTDQPLGHTASGEASSKHSWSARVLSSNSNVINGKMP